MPPAVPAGLRVTRGDGRLRRGPAGVRALPGAAAGAWRWPALAMFAVGYGANHFVPLLAVYRRDLHLTDAAATAVFGVYALGLIPGFLIGGPASDRYGHRRLMIGFAALSLVASAVLMAGGAGVGWLYAGRWLTGVVSGTAFTVGTAWVKELSDGTPGIAARRAALALTAGFGVGPLIAGVVAQWAPLPTVLPYVAHLPLGGVALVLLPRAPETRFPGDVPQGRLRILPASATSTAFRRLVAPTAPWVFGSLSLAFTTLPAHGVRPLGGVAIVFTGALGAAALAAGLGGQHWARRLPDVPMGGRRPTAAVAGLLVVTAGYLVTALATAHPGLVLVVAAALVLGAGYGLSLVGGLREVERLAPPAELGSLVAVYYSLTYCGLAIPYALAVAAPRTGYPPALLVVAAISALTLGAVLAQGRRAGRREPSATGR